VKPTNEQLHRVAVSRLDEIAEGVYLLEFERFFEFEAGQIIRLAWEEEGNPRLYSIASGERDPMVQILFNVVGDGLLTPLLSGLKRGDELFTSKPFGRFTGTDGPAWWIAAGTGIAPFMSMFRTGQHHNKTLIHGGRHPGGFYYRDELSPVLGDRYIPCCSRCSGEGVYPGRITDYLRQLPALPQEPLYYLCGSAEMVVETRELLISRGVAFTGIVSEIYF
jgi:ferredoxin--NADP+ reductase